jgi:hypothetical protein
VSSRSGRNPWIGWILLAVVDVLAVGTGMGVPIFAIAWGVPVGWYAAREAGLFEHREPVRFRRAFLGSAAMAGLTLAIMAVIWGPQAVRLGDPAFDAAGFGIPLILYTSTASFIGWLVLMIVISPVLQLMCSLCTAFAIAMLYPAENPATVGRSAEDHPAAAVGGETNDAARVGTASAPPVG